MSQRFYTASLREIKEYLTQQLQQNSQCHIEVLNPDTFAQTYAGEVVRIDGTDFFYRSYRAWHDLAQKLGCRLLTPVRVNAYLIDLCFEKLASDSFHATEGKEEKYGSDSLFARIHKNEEPTFLLTYEQALKNVKITERQRILDLGINAGDEFALIQELADADSFTQMQLVGIDHSTSAIALARQRFPQENIKFYEHDINALDTLALAPFDLIISIGTFQSPGINFKTLLMELVQNYLSENGAFILGFPNCRWMGGEMVYGAKVPHYNFSEMGLLYSDVMFCKKYLQQKKFRVTITGKEYVFVTATKIGINKV